MLDLAPIGIGADLLDRLAPVGDLHQLRGAAGADADLGLKQRFPFRPVAGVPLLERREVTASGDIMLVGLLFGLVAPGYMRLDVANELHLVHVPAYGAAS